MPKGIVRWQMKPRNVSLDILPPMRRYTPMIDRKLALVTWHDE